MPDVFIGAGSNIDPERNLSHALHQLEEHFGSLTVSSVYRSPAYGFEGDDFLNLVVRVTTSFPAAHVDAALSAIEYAGGRTRAASRFAPRTLDLDLLIYGGCVDPAQRLPRDDVAAYPFVLGPLAEIAPELIHPVGSYTIRSAWNAVRGTSPLTRIGPWTALGSARQQ